MSAPELLFLEDGSVMQWSAQDGSLFLAVTDAAESHEHRVVLGVPDLALMLFSAMDTEPTPMASRGLATRRLQEMLHSYNSRVAALAAQDADAR